MPKLHLHEIERLCAESQWRSIMRRGDARRIRRRASLVVVLVVSVVVTAAGVAAAVALHVVR